MTTETNTATTDDRRIDAAQRIESDLIHKVYLATGEDGQTWFASDSWTEFKRRANTVARAYGVSQAEILDNCLEYGRQLAAEYYAAN